MMRKILIATDFLLGFSAAVGGVILINDPTGSSIGILGGGNGVGGIHDFAIPGFILVILIGMPGMISSLLLMNRHRQGPQISFAFNLLLCGWVIMQMILLPGYAGLSTFYLCLGIISMLMSMKLSGKVAM